MKRLWLAALYLLTVPGVAGQVDITPYDYGWLVVTKQDRLEGIRCAFSKFNIVRGTSMCPVSEGGLDTDLPSMLALTSQPTFVFGNRMLFIETNAQRIRRFQYNPWENKDWITLADVQPPLVVTEYHAVVIRMLQTYAAWKNKAENLMLESLSDSCDPGFDSLIEWQLSRREK